MEQAVQASYDRRWLVFAVTSVGTFMATLDSSIVNVALPEIAGTFHVSLPVVQWIVSAYLLTISCLLPLFGRVGDMFGHRIVYTIGFLVFTLGSAMCGLAFHIGMLIGARVLQAIGAAMLMANASALVTAAFPSSERGRALGTTSMVVALGSMTGPSIGGILLDSFGWESIFYVNLPIGIIGFIAGQLYLPRADKRKRELFDFIGALLFAVGMTAFLLAVSHGEEWGWLSAKVIVCMVVAALAFIGFVRQEKRVDHPMLDLKLFKSWPFFSGTLSGLLSFLANSANLILFPFYLTSVLQLSPAHIGLLMTPFPILMALIAPVSGYLSDRVNPAFLSTTGLTIVAAGLLYMLTLTEHSALWQVALGPALMGAGNGLFQSPNNNSVMSAVKPAQFGIAGSMNALVRNLGQTCGIAITVSIFENRQLAILAQMPASPERQLTAFLYGYHVALIVGAVFALAGALLSFARRSHLQENIQK